MRTAADRILRSVFPIILRLVLTKILRFVLSEVTWIKGMRHELIFAWQALNAYNHANTSCGQFIKSLCGDYRSAKIVVAAEHEISRRKINRIDIFPDDFNGIGLNQGKAVANCQACDQLLALLACWCYYYLYFILFFYHNIIAYVAKIAYLYRVINWDIIAFSLLCGRDATG